MINFYRLVVVLFFSASVCAQVNPVLTIVASATAVCKDSPVIFTASTSATALSYSWSVLPGTGALLSSTSEETVSAIFSRDQSYTLNISVETDSGTLTAKRIIPVVRNAKASFSASFLYPGYPTELELTNFSTATVKNYWIFSGDEPIDSAFSTVKAYSRSGNYTVTLVAVGARNCNDTSSYSFKIADSSAVILPNVFTPNGDGANDIYKPTTFGIAALNGYVFGRDGTLVYSWNTVNGFWDGHFVNGTPCANGVYFVVVDAIGFDDKPYKLSGTVTLLR